MMVVLNKGNDDFEPYAKTNIGITIHSVIGNILFRFLLDILLNNVTDEVLPESRCGFRHGSGVRQKLSSSTG